ncbi:MAG: divalent-cation tolerance protein CutA [Rhodospirillaceae bacterium]|nr:divalent-cation tolerance protein CutA [Rhodospirillaceae bacterium]
MTAYMIYVITPNETEAFKISQTLVDEHLVACANILPGMISIYRWKDNVEQSQEVLLFLKTTKANIKAVTERVISLHSYDCPCVVNWPITGGNLAFLNWIKTETSSQ